MISSNKIQSCFKSIWLCIVLLLLGCNVFSASKHNLDYLLRLMFHRLHLWLLGSIRVKWLHKFHLKRVLHIRFSWKNLIYSCFLKLIEYCYVAARFCWFKSQYVNPPPCVPHYDTTFARSEELEIIPNLVFFWK
jgi:hypothetical protein